ncbi:hypothetical protein [Litchfieldia salsa]|uniref:Uncharacterized protein n=1 Tax=Litchfieldia salsa TaxID=930152 RepID=A0A1H0PLU2_9BACI|nr:hypothetical protein [Litchfieldia salsa]SDP05964.1 hypothetical protein SAMN05216565_101374 [Litchfieldia salsa]
MKIRQFEEELLYEFSSRFQLYNSNAVVIPSFILHIISPIFYPLYDQHVERGKRALCGQEIDVKPNQLNIESYKEYQTFFYEFYNNYSKETSLVTIKIADAALWSFGKWIKGLASNEVPKFIRAKNDGANTDYKPDDRFKRDVLEMVDSGSSQKEAMESIANKHNVKLKVSYFQYPGSHINRWRTQLEHIGSSHS